MEGKATNSGVETLETNYETFEPAAYLECYYSPQGAHLDREDSVIPWAVGRLHKAFSDGDVKGDLLLDVGSGPTVYQVMSGCEVFNKIILTDYSEANRKELKLWIQNEGGCKMDWTPFLQHICKLEGRSPSDCTEKEAKLRKAIQDVFPIDVLRPQPLGPDVLPEGAADCIVSCFCLDCASPDVATFTRALANIGTFLRSGGHLLLIGILGGRHYCGASGVMFPILDLNEAQVCQSVRDSGYNLVRLEASVLPKDVDLEMADVTGVFFVKAKKI